MIHYLKIKPKYYNYILTGTKRIEVRLFDEKRRKIKVNDIIEFQNADNLNEKFKAKVVDLFKYKTFEELINSFDTSILADKSLSKEELISILNEFYTKEEELKYGAIGIKIDLEK